MKNSIAFRVAQAIQLLHLDGHYEYTNIQLAEASMISRKTITRNKDLIVMIDFALQEAVSRHI